MTPLFGWLMGSHVGHVVMQAHFILSGYLFYWVLDRHRSTPAAVAVLGSIDIAAVGAGRSRLLRRRHDDGHNPMAVEWYGIVRPEWVTDPLRDTCSADKSLGALSEIPSVIVLIAIAVQWSRSDEREAKRRDRAADRDGNAELEEYNAYLQSCNHVAQHAEAGRIKLLAPRSPTQFV
jgi:cytochrome c oxidase assembly factor CtaG